MMDKYQILQGFAIITILQNDLSNGIIGFADASREVIVNEDTSPTFTLYLTRINAYFGEVEVSIFIYIQHWENIVNNILLLHSFTTYWHAL